MRKWPVAPVKGLPEERVAAARLRGEELLAKAGRILSAVAEAELARRVITQVEPTEALAVPGDAAGCGRVGGGRAGGGRSGEGPGPVSIVPRSYELQQAVQKAGRHPRTRSAESPGPRPTAGRTR